MTKTETKIIAIFNPFSDSVESLVCEIELFFSKGKLQQACITSIMSQADVNLMGWLKTERLEEIEQEFMEAYNG